MNTKVTCDNCGRKGFEPEEHHKICPICYATFLKAIERADVAEAELHRIKLKAFREMV